MTHPGRGARLSLAALVALLGVAGPSAGTAREAQPGRPVWNAVLKIDGAARVGPLAPGDRVPDFSATGLDGRRVDWTEALGRPAVLIVWASWCPHCQRELPLFGRVAPEFPTVSVVTVTTSVGRHPGPSPAELVKSRGLPFPVAVDDARNTLARALGVYRYPMIYWVGPDGTVQEVTEGERGEASIRASFRALAALAR